MDTETRPLVPPHATPIARDDRIAAIDVVRGVAILGILPVNLLAFKGSFASMAFGSDLWGASDRAAHFVTMFLFSQKFYSIFAFLFGLGLAVQQERLEARGIPVGPRWRRRLVVLLGIGAVHAFLIWWGDILLIYAALGFALPAFLRVTPRIAVRWAVVLGSLPWVLQIGLFGLIGLVSALSPEFRDAVGGFVEPVRAGFAEHAARAAAVYGSSDWVAMIGQRALDVGRQYANGFVVFPYIFGLMLGGYAFGKAGLHRRLDALTPALARALPWLAAAGLAGNALYAIGFSIGDPLTPSLPLAAAIASAWIGIPALAATYAITIALASRRAGPRGWPAPFAAVGRTALSCYLAQSIVATTVFYGYGLGLYGQIGPAAGWVVIVAIWAAIVPAAVGWTRYFRFGPVEWLWRSLTYGERQPMRR